MWSDTAAVIDCQGDIGGERRSAIRMCAYVCVCVFVSTFVDFSTTARATPPLHAKGHGDGREAIDFLCKQK